MKQVIKNILSDKLFIKSVKIRDEFKYISLSVAKKNRFTAFVSLIFDRKYLNEHYSFLQGAYDYENKIRKGINNIYFLRRNIHRIEKGLTMIPLRDVFALRFIEETIAAFSVAVDERLFEKASEYDWSYNILNEYFIKTNSEDIRYKNAKTTFEKIKRFKDMSEIDTSEVPVRYVNDMNETDEPLGKLLLQRKSVRWFSDRKVEKSKINKALEAASLAPSSCNRQPYRYIIISEPDKAREVGKIPAGTVGWSSNIQCLAVLVGDQKAFSNSANRHSIFVDSTLSVMPFVLTLESQGLSTCIINWADNPSQELKMANLLSMKPSEKVILSIAIGHSRENVLVPFSKRKSTEEISTYLG